MDQPAARAELDVPRPQPLAQPEASTRNRNLLVLLAAVVVAAAMGWLAGRTITSPAEEAAKTAPPKPSLITVPVEKRQLTEDVVTRGTVGYGSPVEVTLPASTLRTGNTIVTLPPMKDAALAEGAVALVISGRPVFVLQGDLPTYRDMTEGISGPDIGYLETALRRMGFNPGPVDGVFDRSTRAAVNDLFISRGFGPAPGNLAADEVVFLPQLPVRVDEVTTKAGATPEGPVMTLTSSKVAVASSLSAEDVKLVHEGAAASLEDPDRGIRASGTVSVVATKPGTNEVEAQRFYLEVVPTDAPPTLLGAAVVVTVAVRSTQAEVLAVPLAALSTAADGTTRVEVVNPDGGTRILGVKPGLSAKGMVEVAPLDGALNAGDQVVVGVTSTTKTTRGGSSGP